VALFPLINRINPMAADTLIRYTVVTCYTTQSLVDAVNERLKNGWKLQGGVCNASDERAYHQAMYREL
jgi:hypothetical protein